MINLKNYKDAINYSEKLVRDFGSSRYKNEIFKQHVEILYRTGDYQNAKKYIENILINASDSKSKMEAFNVIGWLAYETNNLNDAVENWKNAINIGYSENNSQAFEIAKTCIEALSETNDSAKTLSLLNEIKAKFPTKKTELDLETAKVYMNTNKYSQAEVLLNSVLSTGLYFNEVNYLMAVLNKEKNNSSSAFEYIKRVINSGNSDYVYKGYLFEGDLYFQLSNYKNAKISYENAMKVADNFGKLQCLLNLGIVEMELSDYNQAKLYFKELKTYSVTDLDAALNGALYLAEVYLQMNDTNNAIKEYDWIISNDNTGKYISNSLMKKYDILLSASSVNVDNVIVELDNQINATTDLILKDELKFLKAEAYMKKGDLLTAYNFCRDVNSDRLSAASKAAVLYIRGKYFISQGNEDEMKITFDELINEFPNSPKTPWAMQDYALYYYNNQNYNQSKNLFFNLLTKYPDFQKVDVAYFYIGLGYEKMGESDKTKQIFNDFLEKFPNSGRTDEVKQHLSWLE
jgi:tetratricopeptide (TPR) repeat protein